MRFTVDRLDHLVITTRDVEITAAWYQRVLGMEREDFGPDRRCALKFGGQKINVRPEDAENWSTARIGKPGTQDLCFVAAVGPADVVAHLHACGVAIEQGPVRKIGALGEMRSVYCRDPDGNLIEIASYLAD
jgi:catechol 2,3-dioxygenase-like lactoylglutathione lyase family enzyme